MPRGRLTTVGGREGTRFWILGNETSIWRKVTQSFYTLCALLSFVQCWAWRERAKEPWGGGGVKEKGGLWGVSEPRKGQARTCYCTEFSNWENSKRGHQGS